MSRRARSDDDEGSSAVPGQQPPRQRFNCGRLDMRIARDGTWFYHGSPIGRKEMVRLFASVLARREDGTYWLVTPAEEGLVEVDDAPFLAVELFREGEGRAARLSFRTNVDEHVPLDADHPLRLNDRDIGTDEGGAVPYLHVRNGLEARIARSVYYELVTLGGEEVGAADESGANQGGRRRYGIWSNGIFFPLGTLPRELPTD